MWMSTNENKNVSRTGEMNWFLVLYYIHLHLFGVYGFWLLLFEAKWMTVLFAIFVISIACFGVTVGAHRYYAHRTFEALIPLRYFFLIAQTIAGVGPLYDWVRYHRIHHKYYDTDKDPYSTNKGFWYSYFISYIMNLNLKEEELKKIVDMRDIENDSSVLIQRSLYWSLVIPVTLLILIFVPMEYWNESAQNSIFIMGFLRLLITSSVSKMVNSAILIWGLKRGDKFPVDDNSIFYITKSYWLNYHYLLPWDWKSSEFGKYDKGCGTIMIKILRNFGLVSLLKTSSTEDVRNIIHKFGSKSITLTEAITELQKRSEEKAKRENLRFIH
ncbi:acyl-CoA Delta(11) desaturase-like isoform X2 [Vespa mandarinia]|uniref:acyl-CoA Delta(11) desaturase-like isoform X2 n=1 Tax=Vespa mandarinia TaxID=7446 RepID=UPI001613D078|nr:acyl-CoA Delta(11) desaturase-like isoform X2 [Vespa mandarinia]